MLNKLLDRFDREPVWIQTIFVVAAILLTCAGITLFLFNASGGAILFVLCAVLLGIVYWGAFDLLKMRKHEKEMQNDCS